MKPELRKEVQKILDNPKYHCADCCSLYSNDPESEFQEGRKLTLDQILALIQAERARLLDELVKPLMSRDPSDNNEADTKLLLEVSVNVIKARLEDEGSN